VQSLNVNEVLKGGGPSIGRSSLLTIWRFWYCCYIANIVIALEARAARVVSIILGAWLQFLSTSTCMYGCLLLNVTVQRPVESATNPQIFYYSSNACPLSHGLSGGACAARRPNYSGVLCRAQVPRLMAEILAYGPETHQFVNGSKLTRVPLFDELISTLQYSDPKSGAAKSGMINEI